MKLMKFNLNFFDGSAAAPGAEGGEGSGEATPEVRYGKPDDSQSDVADQNAETKPVENVDSKPTYEDLIKGDYKDANQKQIDAILAKRFKAHDAKEANRTKALQPLLDKYGVTDLDGLTNAIANDDSLLYDKAVEQGLTTEQLRAQKQLADENAALKKQLETTATEAIYNDWDAQAAELKKSYPSFDMRAEVQNQQFIDVLNIKGTTVQQAFNFVHGEEIKKGIVKSASETAKTEQLDNIKARGMRPAENGLNTKPGIVYKSDPSKFTNDEMKDILKRVSDGEKIKF